MNIAIITGASSGLGVEYLKAVLENRPDIEKIIIAARRKERLDALAEHYGERVFPVKADITDKDDVEYIKSLVEDGQYSVRLLINNAGYGKLGDFDKLPPADNAGMVRLNCEALCFLTSVILPYMPNGSEIINTCSIASFAPNIRMATYSATKAFVMHLSRALREELKSRKINVLAVCPGPMNTEFLPVANIEKGSSKMFDSLPRVNPAKMAKKSLAASKKGKSVYTNRFIYKLYRVVAKITPKSIMMKFAKT